MSSLPEKYTICVSLEGECPICFEDYADDIVRYKYSEKTEKTNEDREGYCIITECCKQIFHADCLLKWDGRCPNCRGQWKIRIQRVSSHTSTTTINHIHAINYNVFRIMSGLGGLAYSNFSEEQQPEPQGTVNFSRIDTSDYFNLVQPYYHHSNAHDTRSRDTLVYSFALNPEETQNIGYMPMSRIDPAVISFPLINYEREN